MTAEDLYKIYAAWTGQLHFYCVKELGRHVDVEYFPNDYFFRIYSGHAEGSTFSFGYGSASSIIPSLMRPACERSEIVKVPRPEDSPSAETLEEAFRALCLAAARVLEVQTGKAALPAPNEPINEKHAFLKDAPKRTKPKNRKPDEQKRSGILRLSGSGSASKPGKRSASPRKDR